VIFLMDTRRLFKKWSLTYDVTNAGDF
jgi:hypothetical protein